MTTLDTLSAPPVAAAGAARQRIEFRSGDEASLIAAGQIGSSQDDPGMAYGAALAGKRVVGTTDSHGLRSGLGALGAAARTRVPMVLNAACEPADLYAALGADWIVLCARDPQAVYDLSFAAVRIGEHRQVRLPVLVAYDGLVTRHEKRRIHVVDEPEAIAGFLGTRPQAPSPLDPEHAATFGGNVSNEKQLSQAKQAARGVIAEVFADLARLTGRTYPAATLADGGILSIELGAALKADWGDGTKAGEAFGAPAPEATAARARTGLAPVRADEVSRGMAKVRRDESSGRLEVELEPLWKMTSMPSRLAPGHGACPGCGASTMLHQIYKVLEGQLVVLFQSGCAIAVTSGESTTAHRINVIHDLAGNGVATLCGLLEACPERKDITFVLITGDGAMEESLAGAIGAASRNTRIMLLEYDNQGRMSTGGQPTLSTALGRRICADEIFAACHLPYLFTATEGYPEDLMRKVAKAQWYAKNEGMVYGKILSFCPLNWRTADDAAQPVLQAAIDSCFFPLYEVERGHTAITYDPDATNRRRPVADWLSLMGKTAHLLDPANRSILEDIQAETDRRWARLKAMHEHPLL